MQAARRSLDAHQIASRSGEFCAGGANHGAPGSASPGSAADVAAALFEAFRFNACKSERCGRRAPIGVVVAWVDLVREADALTLPTLPTLVSSRISRQA